ncbi:hypothetical protein [Limnohabitans sp. Bal53]|uniref:hypothetical protein n=1 Tax=Limnohabitans sp. Bal53 TaxID=1977910 RepID=UPI000D3A639E|nr:hypothetical protein [Limnohabitans sp. Bal53]PUE41803.1 hypothetical protein B9Z50_09085 [Limnohabitans sp. Bal53]
MSNLLSPLPSLPALSPTAPSGSGALLHASGRSGAFGQMLADVAIRSGTVQAQEGDTLIGLVKAHYRQNQQPITEQQAMRLAHQIAARNQIGDPNLILTGQKIDFSSLQMPALARSESAGPLDLNPRNARSVAQLASPAPLTANALASRPVAWTRAPDASGQHPVLDKTLERAVAKGFVPAAEVSAVKDRILALADRFNFQPDDFARLSLMESGGMNPQASNGNCHGIIQFCDGPNRGAASVGLKDNPRAILGMGLLQQLDLVDRYFSQAGLRVKGPPVGLDDLYLTVLTPAARQETRPDAPLPIAGPQARYLHVGQDTRGPITRNSILAGLHNLTNALLPPRAATAATTATTAVGSAGKGNLTRLYDEVASTLPTALR